MRAAYPFLLLCCISIVGSSLTIAIVLSYNTSNKSLPLNSFLSFRVKRKILVAGEAGAASVHIHARDPKANGKPTADLEVYREITDINRRSNVIVCITTGGSLTATPEQRISVVLTFKPELASFNCGSLTPDEARQILGLKGRDKVNF